MPKARSDNIGHLKSVFQEPEQDDTVVKEKKKINRNPPFRREGNLGWEPVSVLLDLQDTEHTAYTVGHPCKPYIQPNQLWPYRSNTRAIRVYP